MSEVHDPARYQLHLCNNVPASSHIDFCRVSGPAALLQAPSTVYPRCSVQLVTVHRPGARLQLRRLVHAAVARTRKSRHACRLAAGLSAADTIHSELQVSNLPSALHLREAGAGEAFWSGSTASHCHRPDRLHMTASDHVLTKTASDLNLRPCRHQVQAVLPHRGLSSSMSCWTSPCMEPCFVCGRESALWQWHQRNDCCGVCTSGRCQRHYLHIRVPSPDSLACGFSQVAGHLFEGKQFGMHLQHRGRNERRCCHRLDSQQSLFATSSPGEH